MTGWIVRPIAVTKGFIVGTILAAGSLVSGESIQQDPSRIRFEVASIKPMDDSFRNGFSGYQMNLRSGTVTVIDQSVREIIVFAYGVQSFQISGGPKWIADDRFVISAKAERGPVTTADIKRMLQSLLEDRFNFKFHRETTQDSGYALTVGKNGVRLRPSADSEESGRIGKPTFGPLMAQASRIQTLAEWLSLRLQKAVIDRTDLTGLYDFTLSWAPGENEFEQPSGLPVRSSAENTGPSLMTALQEQLGLKLEVQKVSVDVIVIDHVEQPKRN